MKAQAKPVTFNSDSLREFKALVDKAQKDGIELFEYRERTYSVRYARYLVEYLEPKLREEET